jgi:hypothetical protein
MEIWFWQPRHPRRSGDVSFVVKAENNLPVLCDGRLGLGHSSHYLISEARVKQCGAATMLLLML